MKLALATLVQRIARKTDATPRPVAVPVQADPFDRLARIVRVERAREDAVLRSLQQRHAG